jgi:rifampicin phosphotransferase
MKDWLCELDRVAPDEAPLVGGKALALARLVQAGLRVPRGFCITTAAYRHFVARTELGDRIRIELARKPFEEMRWEEVWDTALRIRNLFARTALTDDLATSLREVLRRFGEDRALVIRSSAPGEDAAGSSFAGLHESFVNVRGVEEALERVRLVWASLWSDAALLYRQELGLDVERSAMAVVVQELAQGERSGVAFTVSPTDPEQAVIEAVHGLNQGLVDGVIQPDRWIFRRRDRTLISHATAERRTHLVAISGGVQEAPLAPERSDAPPLTEEQAQAVLDMALRCEEHFGSPQDVEWTFTRDNLFALQSRPITALQGERPDPRAEDKRPWYRSLTRSFENLKELREKIENEILPGMDAAAQEMAGRALDAMPESDLADEIDRRAATIEYWRQRYWEDLIPFAHGMRLFGKYYNDVVRPRDPYEFLDLLVGGELLSLQRNGLLTELAAMARASRDDREALATSDRSALSPAFRTKLAEYEERFGHQLVQAEKDELLAVIVEMSDHGPADLPRSRVRRADLEREFLNRFRDERLPEARERLELARASYRLRDDDNVYLDRVHAQVQEAAATGSRRLAARGRHAQERLPATEIAALLRDPRRVPPASDQETLPEKDSGAVRSRQLLGQPAGPGVARGIARVIADRHDLRAVQRGEVLVCDTIDPTMTHIVPLAAALVERRGGMLIHGAIIAREYGLPCVTGVAHATRHIRTGDRVTVDGYLGIVTVATDEVDAAPAGPAGG